MYFAEERRVGKWVPVTYAEKPSVKDGWFINTSGKQARIRNVTEVPPELADKPLSEIALTVNETTKGGDNA